MSPRSILKHNHPYPHPHQHQHQHPEFSSDPFLSPEPFPFAACSTVLLSPHVHFPPTPSLTSTFTTHSSTSYDRTPLVVAPNSCALPGRHEREFTDAVRREELKGSYFHPRAYEACCSPEPASSSSSPSSPSLSSSIPESDDSDGMIMTPPDPTLSRPMIPYAHSQEELDTAFSFLAQAQKQTQMHRSSSLKERRHKKTHTTRSREGSNFSVPSLDFEGCLGGF